MTHSYDGLTEEFLLGLAKTAEETFYEMYPQYDQRPKVQEPAPVENNSRLFEADSAGAISFYYPADGHSLGDYVRGLYTNEPGWLVGYQGPEINVGDVVQVYPLKNVDFKWTDLLADPGEDVPSYGHSSFPDPFAEDLEGDDWFTDVQDQPIEAEDVVNHPAHYTAYKGLEVIQLTEQMNFNRGNAVKYIARAGLKDPASEVQDLEKARWYIDREINRITEEN